MDKKKRGRGRPKKIETPERLWELFEKYVEEKPQRFLKKGVYNQKTGEADYIPVEQPLTWLGFSAWLSWNNIIDSIDDYKANKDNMYDDYSGIIKKIDKIIKSEMMQGATSGIYKENIVARILGLADKKETKTEGTITIDFTDD